MKRILLTTTVATLGLFAQAQIITHVVAPEALSGGLAFEWADNWQTPPATNFNTPGVHVQAMAAIGRDSLACAALTNPDEIAGKIAVVWRGTCEFGAKALAAQNAGAVACVIVNNQGAPVGMAAGTSGASVTIPTIMISTDAGLALYDALIAGELELFIGNKQEFFANDLGLSAGTMLMPREASTPAPIAQNASEYSFFVGGWVRNWGNQPQTNAVLTAKVTQGASTLYEEASNPFDLGVGDSIFIEFDDVALSSYNGLYDFTYTLTAAEADDFNADNTIATNFYVGSRHSYGKVDATSLLPVHQEFVQPSGVTTGYTFCSHFRDPNASRLELRGLNIGASVSSGGDITGQGLIVSAHEWAATFEDLSETVDNQLSILPQLTEVAYAQYFYDENLTGQNIYVPFDESYVLEDNVRYLFCVSTLSSSVFLQYQTALPYDLNTDAYLQPSTVNWTDGANVFYMGFSGGGSATIGAEFTATNSVKDVTKVDITPYPNPVNDVLRIPSVKGFGKAQLDITDITGKVVKSQQVNMPGEGSALEVNMTGVSNGTYTFRLIFADGARSTFKVMVNR